MPFRAFLVAVSIAVMLWAAPRADAQSYPGKPVELIVPWARGGGSDTLMRIIAERIEPHLGASLAVSNVPGASGTLGLERVSRAEPDGYTAVQLHEGLLVAHKTGLTDLEWQDFKPVALMTESPLFLVVRTNSGWDALDDFVAAAKDGTILVGVTLAGTPHLHAAMIEDAIGASFSYVGYEGSAQRVEALRSGEVDAVIGDLAAAGEFLESGELSFLAVGSQERCPMTPDVPTFMELGYDLTFSVTRGIVLPAGAPDEARDALEEALRSLSQQESYVEALNEAGAHPHFRGHDEYRAYLEKVDSEIDRVLDRLR